LHWRRGPRWLHPLWAALLPLPIALAGGLLLAGCSSSETLHPALRLEENDYEKAVERGRNLVATGDSPYKAYSFNTQQVNVRVTQEVIIREAACCWPADEIVFLIAKQATDDAAVVRVAKQARRQVEQEIKFSVVMQLPKSRDASELKFAMQSSAGTEYPPIAVEQPILIRDVSSALDPTMPASALYGYDIHFPIQGIPGYPPIGPEVSGLVLIVKDGPSQASVSFVMPTQKPRY
jgi:hypothetical protein